jgi:hypothetical protein
MNPRNLGNPGGLRPTRASLGRVGLDSGQRVHYGVPTPYTMMFIDLTLFEQADLAVLNGKGA